MRETFPSFIQYSDRETNLKFISCRTAVRNNEKERERKNGTIWKLNYSDT